MLTAMWTMYSDPVSSRLRSGFRTITTPLQKTKNTGGIDTVKKRQCFFLIQTDIGDSRHSAESYIGIKYLTQFIMFPVFVEYLFAESPERALYFMYFKAVKIKKFME